MIKPSDIAKLDKTLKISIIRGVFGRILGKEQAQRYIDNIDNITDGRIASDINELLDREQKRMA